MLRAPPGRTNEASGLQAADAATARARPWPQRPANPDEALEGLWGSLEWQLALEVRRMVAHDRDDYVNGLGERVAGASTARDPKSLRKALRAVLPLRRKQELSGATAA